MYYIFMATVPTEYYNIIKPLIPPSPQAPVEHKGKTTFVYGITSSKRYMKKFRATHNKKVFQIRKFYLTDGNVSEFESDWQFHMIDKVNVLTGDEMKYTYKELITTEFEFGFPDVDIHDTIIVVSKLLGLKFGSGYKGDLYIEKYRKSLDELEYKDIGYCDKDTLPFKPLEVDAYKLYMTVFALFY